jgi:hypothetical protein
MKILLFLDQGAPPLSGSPDVPELFIGNLWEWEHFNSDLFERNKISDTRYLLQEKITFQNRICDFNHDNRSM